MSQPAKDEKDSSHEFQAATGLRQLAKKTTREFKACSDLRRLAYSDDASVMKRRLQYAWDEIAVLSDKLAAAGQTAEEEDQDAETAALAFQREIERLRNALEEKDGELKELAVERRQLEYVLDDQDAAFSGLKRQLALKEQDLAAALDKVAILERTQQELKDQLDELAAAQDLVPAEPVEQSIPVGQAVTPSPMRKHAFFVGLPVALVLVTSVTATVWSKQNALTPLGDGTGTEVSARAYGVAVKGPSMAEPPAAIEGALVRTGEPDSGASGELPTPAPRLVRDPLSQGSLGPPMIAMDEGSFSMGSASVTPRSDESPVHVVNVKRFLIGAYEVTFEEYDRFARATGRRLPDDFGRGRGRHPVFDISWSDAQTYAQWLSRETGQRYRLPSEAEWEYAARAATSTPFWWGYDPGVGRAVCFDCGTGWDNRSPAPVGSFLSNPFGLYDSSGNLMEWVADCYHSNYGNAPVDGSAWESAECSSRVARGGAFNKPAKSMRSADRHSFAPDTRIDMIGFRLARDV
ncbi:MAG: SUMF1/EgtB/PvdO family nonheme iron enzyme [Pseudomonadota bacterium]|nr:SUMF1/EgtB/PvdO family nonheme iron enzyme [Pseudomonadota bacterium]